MSNIFSKYQKELSGVRVIDSRTAFVYNPKTKKKDIPNPRYEFVGKIDIVYPHVILKMNKTGCKTGYVEDSHILPKRVKQDLVNHFFDKHGNKNSKTKAYLIRTDRHRAKGSGVVK